MQGKGNKVSQTFEFRYDGDGERADQYVVRMLSGRTRSQIQKWIREGAVTVNGRRAKAGRRLELGDVVQVIEPEHPPSALAPVAMTLVVRYEDADCLVVDKPAGMVVHPATSHRQDTLVNGLLDRYPELAQMIQPDDPDRVRPGIVHRLDKDTSGLLVVARHEAARKALQAQFQAREVNKVYRTLLHGRLGEQQGQIILPLGRDPHNRQRVAVVPNGREAITEYEVESFLLTLHGVRESFTLARVRLVTGRTHQIRVHFAHLGHPVVGDAVYGRRKTRAVCPRQFLHAWRLAFLQPMEGTPVVVESPLPADLEGVLARLEAVV